MKQVALFGAGRLGRFTNQQLLLTKNYEVVGFVDNNQNLWGSVLDEVTVYSPSMLKSFGGLCIITVYTNADVINQLNEMGIAFITFAQLAREIPDLFLPHGSIPLPSAVCPSESDLDEIEQCSKLWSDEKSVIEFINQIAWRKTLNYSILPPYDDPKDTYFPKDLFHLGENESFVDCGAFDGDSIKAFLSRTSGKAKAIYAFEPDKENFKKIEDKFFCKNTNLYNFGLSNKNEFVSFDSGRGAGSKAGEGKDTITCVSLDSIGFDHGITFLKMDIEGYETLALQGALRTIRKHNPILAICLYHKPEDLWKIPILVHGINPDYNLYLRRYSSECWEQVLYAVPQSRVLK